MKFIRDIIKESRNSAAVEREKFHDDAASKSISMPVQSEARLPETPVNAQTVEKEDGATTTVSRAGAAEAHADARLSLDRTVQGTAQEPSSALKIAVDSLAAEADDEAVLKALNTLQEDVQEDASDDETAFEPVSKNEGDGFTDPFEKLRTTQDQSEKGVTGAPRVSALGKVKPKHLKLGDASTRPREVKPASSVDDITPLADAMEPEAMEMPSPAAGRGSSRSGRVKTRLLGFSAGAIEQDDPFEKSARLDGKFPVGWLVVISEMGRGASFALHDGVSKVGRGTDQTVCLDFGDNSISRDNHISIAFDAEQNKFFVGHSGKANLVRINNVPLLSTEELKSKDLIRLGETTLRFIAFCEEDFGWETLEEQASRHA